MSRLKFRVYDSVQKKMVYNVGVDPSGIAYSIHSTQDTAVNRSEFYYYTDSEIMQSTGLFDKNNLEIFESDVCRYLKNEPLIVEWVNHEFGWRLVNHRSKYKDVYRFDCDIEVIGTIYEHPHLLEEK
jgi:uncharacterized phage protein (TIGR01671 family)